MVGIRERAVVVVVVLKLCEKWKDGVECKRSMHRVYIHVVILFLEGIHSGIEAEHFYLFSVKASFIYTR